LKLKDVVVIHEERGLRRKSPSETRAQDEYGGQIGDQIDGTANRKLLRYTLLMGQVLSITTDDILDGCTS
jgi:hypothetical protein